MTEALTMNKIRAQNYKVFESLDKEVAKIQESSIKYIEHLGTITGTNISEWKPLELFTSEDGKLPSKRNKLNELFFLYLEQKKGEIPEVIVPGTDEISKLCFKFDQLFTQQIDGTIKRSEAIIHDIDGEIERYHDSIKKKLASRIKVIATVDGLHLKKKTGTGVSADIHKILSEGWWTLSENQTPNEISLVTPEIVLTYFNKKHAAQVAVSVGFIQINLGIDGGSIYAWGAPYDRNPLHNKSYFHPHISGHGGDICFGNMAKEFQKAQTSSAIDLMLDTIKKVLTTYCDENPYVHLYQLEDAAKEGNLYSRGHNEAAKKIIREAFLEHRFLPYTGPNPVQASLDQMYQVAMTSTQGLSMGGLQGMSPQMQAAQAQQEAVDAAMYVSGRSQQWTTTPGSSGLGGQYSYTLTGPGQVIGSPMHIPNGIVVDESTVEVVEEESVDEDDSQQGDDEGYF